MAPIGMLKVRIIPTLLWRDTGLVKGERFDSWRVVGSAQQAVRVYNLREVDELVFLDITATRQGRLPDFALIEELTTVCFMPLTVGGGVRRVEDFRGLLLAGADKVAVNTAAVETPSLVDEAARRFGSQAVVASIDARRHADGRLEVFTHSGTRPTGLDPVAHARELERRGAGEILLCSINRDGTMTGYDVSLVRAVTDAVAIPVIASGGAGNAAHMAEVLRDGRASAVAAAALFHFTEQTPREIKQALAEAGFPTRL